MKFSQLLANKINKYGLLFDASELPDKFIPYFESGQRIIVKSPWGETERGYVGITTGWKPSFLLLKTKRSLGSDTLLNERYQIIGTVNRYK